MKLIKRITDKLRRKPLLVKPVVRNSIEYCDTGCGEENTIHVNVMRGSKTVEKWLCKECIKIEVGCGNMVEIL